MYPSQTSLIPVSVALARFVESNGIYAFKSWYQYWYLGVPFRYLSGPLTPILLTFLHKIFYNSTLFSISVYLAIFSILISAIGWGLLVKKISKETGLAILVSILLCILPWRYFSALALDELSKELARAIIPFIFIAYWQYVRSKKRSRYVVLVILTVFLLLINTEILAILAVGLIAITISKSFRNGKIRKPGKLLKRTFIYLSSSLLLVTFYYGANYWLTILSNPSIGGVSGLKVIFRIFDLLKSSLPLFLAIFTVYFSKKIRSRLGVFTLTWILTFAFLTVFRFMGDPDFWQDWTSWMYEIEIGIALLISNYKNRATSYVLLATLLIFPFYLTWRVNIALGNPRLLSKEIPVGVSSFAEVSKIIGDDRVYLSGSTVFWADSLYNLDQIRGGYDSVSTNYFIPIASYQLREGDDPDLARAWSLALGIKYLLVNTEKSKEYYHDFKNISKWDEVGKNVWSKNGDILYEIEGSSIVWEVNPAIENLKPPSDGKDLGAIEEYLSKRIGKLEYIKKGSGIVVSNNSAQEILILVTYDSKHIALNEKKEQLKIEKDILGNTLIKNTNGSYEVHFFPMGVKE